MEKDESKERRNMKVKNIACIGAGYVGGPTMAKIAQRCPEITVTVVDLSEDRIKAWNSEELPIYEPGLMEVVRDSRGKNLFFSTNVEKAIHDAEMIFVAVQTPTKRTGEGAGEASDLSYWLKTAQQIREHADSPKIIVEKSTVPVGTATFLSNILNDGQFFMHHSVLSNPEFLAEGTAMRDLENPDRILMGSLPGDEEAEKALVDVYSHWVPREKIITHNLWSAEMAKLAANAFLAQRVSSINSIAALCERTGADVKEVSQSIGLDSRIGPKFLKSGPGFGGSCFKKDILNLVYLFRAHGLEKEAEYWKSVIELNEWQPRRIVRRMLNAMMSSLSRKIAVFGYSFKSNTGDTRETPSKKLVEILMEEGADITITDPSSFLTAYSDFNGKISHCGKDPYDAARGAEAIVVMTDWREYSELDWGKIYSLMNPHSHFLFDCRNCLTDLYPKLLDMGFRVFPIGAEEALSDLPF